MKLLFHLDHHQRNPFNLLLFARDFLESLFTVERHTFLVLRLYLKASLCASGKAAMHASNSLPPMP